MNQTQKFPPSKSELLVWINSKLKEVAPSCSAVRKVEDLGNGVVYCHLFNYLHPGLIPLHKLNLTAKYEYQNLSNLKVLSTAIAKLKVAKHLEIEKIAKMKYQDNLEVVQWLFKYAQQLKKDSTSAQQKGDNSVTQVQSLSMPLPVEQQLSNIEAPIEEKSMTPSNPKRKEQKKKLTTQEWEGLRKNIEDRAKQKRSTIEVIEPQPIEVRTIGDPYRRTLLEVRSVVQRQDENNDKKMEMIQSILFSNWPTSQNKSNQPSRVNTPIQRPRSQNEKLDCQETGEEIKSNAENDKAKSNRIQEGNQRPFSHNNSYAQSNSVTNYHHYDRYVIRPSLTGGPGFNNLTKHEPISKQARAQNDLLFSEQNIFRSNNRGISFGNKINQNPFLQNPSSETPNKSNDTSMLINCTPYNQAKEEEMLLLESAIKNNRDHRSEKMDLEPSLRHNASAQSAQNQRNKSND